MLWRFCLAVLMLAGGSARPQTESKDKSPVLLQAFYWDYHHAKSGWHAHLTRLAPKFREIGITAVWTPPPSKGASGTNDVGYGVFDPYDLGDKWQRGTVATRAGTKDELLRMVATMHAHGIDVVLDVVLNQAIGAEEQDPKAPGNKWKTFRYVSAATSAETPYRSRRGRWPKDWTSFHPNPGHNADTGDIAAEMFGPDLCYRDAAVREQARAWLVWLRKQTDADGWRLDAVKHFEREVLVDALRATSPSIAVGEYVGSPEQLEAWMKSVEGRAGVFDFPLRGAIHGMVTGNGFFRMSDLAPAAPNRFLFVNNHDTYRPQFDGQGRITGWGQEMGGHIHADDPRADVAYGLVFALGGTPVVFYEDLFDLGTDRWTREEPKAREWLVKLIRAYRDFDCGAAKPVVRHADEDVLVVERGLLFAMNDNGVEDKRVTVPTSLSGELVDLLGNGPAVRASGRVEIVVPKMGLVVYGPKGAKTRDRAGRRTTQEFEMDDDLGDLHPKSPGCGGRVGREWRKVGTIWSAAGERIEITTEPALEVEIGGKKYAGPFNAPEAGPYLVRVRREADPARARVKITYRP